MASQRLLKSFRRVCEGEGAGAVFRYACFLAEGASEEKCWG